MATDDLAPVMDIDAVVSLAELTPEVMDWISTLAPYGPENRRPLFASMGVAVQECRVIGYLRQHLRLLVEQDGVTLVALAFNQAQFRDPEVRRLDLAYSLFYDSWQGNKTLALRVSQFRPAQRRDD
jgi:single-stranded-DNA-specific exonuclease